MDNIGYFTLDGHDTTEWGIGLSGTGVWDAPARKGESISVPGRNGNIWVDDGSFENILVTYPCWMPEGFDSNIDDFRAYLSLHSDDYYVLTDTYHPNEYRLGRYAGPFSSVPGTRNITGRFDVVFDCQPLRYLTLYSTWIALSPTFCNTGGVFTPNWSETNPTRFSVMPVLKVSGTPTYLEPDVTGLQIATLNQGNSGAVINLVGAVSGKVYYVDLDKYVIRSSATDLGANWESASIDTSVTMQLFAPEDYSVFTFLNGLSYSGGRFEAGVNQALAMQENLTLFGIIPRYATI